MKVSFHLRPAFADILLQDSKVRNNMFWWLFFSASFLPTFGSYISDFLLWNEPIVAKTPIDYYGVSAGTQSFDSFGINPDMQVIEFTDIPSISGIEKLMEIENSVKDKSFFGYSQQNDKESYIVGGRDALDGEFPWQVSLQRHFEKDNGIYHICGGTIIDKEWIVTAAHCVRISVISSYRVVAGTSDLSEENKIRLGSKSAYSVHKVVDGIVHEEFSSMTLENDIAVLRVEPPFDLGKAGKIETADLPASGHEPHGHATVSGWGTLREGSRVIPTRLQAVSVPLISDDKCREAYGDKIVPSMLCAGYEQGTKDSCQGDSGGPLIQKTGGRASLIGVVSWGQGCARPSKPGVYTQVSYYIDWINNAIKSGGGSGGSDDVSDVVFDDITLNKFSFR